jgi:hypothetical protein
MNETELRTQLSSAVADLQIAVNTVWLILTGIGESILSKAGRELHEEEPTLLTVQLYANRHPYYASTFAFEGGGRRWNG